MTSPQALVAANNFAPSTVAELVAYAKANPGKVTYATVGAGSSNHLNALLLSGRTGIDMVHVPYKGGAPMMIDLVGGQVNVMFVSAPQAIPQVKAGRIKALAIGSPQRIAQLPAGANSRRDAARIHRAVLGGSAVARRDAAGYCRAPAPRARRRRSPMRKSAASSSRRASTSSAALPENSSPLPARNRTSGRK